jgi:predicted amidophosphoribosyltransferase
MSNGKADAGEILGAILVGVLGGLIAVAIIDALTGNASCPTCHQQVKKGVTSCPHCGTTLRWQ